MLSTSLSVSLSIATLVVASTEVLLASNIDGSTGGPPSPSLNVSTCPGYTLASVQDTLHGLLAQLVLGGPACNAFGNDIVNLTVEVTYETRSRLHVNIFDTPKLQFTLPDEFFPRPPPPNDTIPSLVNTSDLVFNYEPAPFAFWITRRADTPDKLPLFDTRANSLPPAPIASGFDDDMQLDGFDLVFEDQYLQLTSALPLDANVYGLGEAVSTSGFRRNVSPNGTIQTMWARNAPDPPNENLYGSHAVYLEHRFDNTINASQSHGVFLSNSAGADILLATPPGSNTSLIQYRMLGGTLDLYFLSGPEPKRVIEQYSDVVGLPTWQPMWAFGFHLCRWGYQNLSEVQDQVQRMREANIPLEVMWNDIDLYHARREFTTDPVSFPNEGMRAFIGDLTSNDQHYIPIVDAAIGHTANDSDLYYPFITGMEQSVFITNPDNSTYIGQVWPGYTVFPDWFAENVEEWWADAIQNWSASGIEFSGLWLDMNEAASFCDGSCGTGADLSNTSVPVILPGEPGDLVTEYPEGYNSTISGPSGNITVNDTLTYGAGNATSSPAAVSKRGVGVPSYPGVDLNAPPYTIHNPLDHLSVKTLAMNATHAGGYAELDTHNLFGYMEERATHLALLRDRPSERPFLISRSTFAGSGRWTGHWLGDNFSKWVYMKYSIQGVLQFQLFQIPMVGADTCGFYGNTDEELCGRWMQLSAFMPFYRNHNERGAISQEPYRWDSVANASRTAMSIRYSMLPYWYTLFANASLAGTPPVRALFWEFPDEPELYGIDEQFMVGGGILVTPVLTPNVSTVRGIFPGRGSVTWRDWYTHETVDAAAGQPTALDAPLGHIPVHIRSGTVLLLHSRPGYTTAETRRSPYALLVSHAADGSAFGSAYVDDGETRPGEGGIANRTVTFVAETGAVRVSSAGSWAVERVLESVTVLGVQRAPTRASVGGLELDRAAMRYDAGLQRLILSGLAVDLNTNVTIQWT
ncbi:glycosyl hydrolases family 31-domain-containing protein [Amylostereum chailletii]|nr:glycosyl hydrolases family 31-domain-containing protein [Amylostereum chailletii]